MGDRTQEQNRLRRADDTADGYISLANILRQLANRKPFESYKDRLVFKAAEVLEKWTLHISYQDAGRSRQRPDAFNERG